MPTTNSKYQKLLFPSLLLLAVLATWAFNRFRHRDADEVFIQARPIQSSLGWGYEVVADGKTYIHQEFIPAIPGKHGFKTKEDALKVGQKVISKISANQVPTITVDELKGMGIINDSLEVK
jgi:hypothetical protein